MGYRSRYIEKNHFPFGPSHHATLLLAHGVDIYTVSKLLGHKHLASTEPYGHITDVMRLKAVQKLSGVLAKKDPES